MDHRDLPCKPAKITKIDSSHSVREEEVRANIKRRIRLPPLPAPLPDLGKANMECVIIRRRNRCIAKMDRRDKRVTTSVKGT